MNQSSVRRAATVPGTNAGSFAPSTTNEVTDVDLAEQPTTPEPPARLTVEDVKIGRADAGGRSPVTERATGLPVGSVTARVAEDGTKTWTPCDLTDEPLTYPSGAPKSYLSRTLAVRSLLDDDLNRPETWADAPAYDWTRQHVNQWGKRYSVAEMTRDTTLLHGSPHRFEPGDVLVPDQAPVNFKQSDPFTVALTNERGTANHWARQAAKSSGSGSFYVYEVEPLTPVKAWRFAILPESARTGAVEGASLRLEEGRVGAARIVNVHEVTR